jgi:hypothetical protein
MFLGHWSYRGSADTIGHRGERIFRRVSSEAWNCGNGDGDCMWSPPEPPLREIEVARLNRELARFGRGRELAEAESEMERQQWLQAALERLRNVHTTTLFADIRVGNGRIIDVQQGVVRIRFRDRDADEGSGGRRRMVRLPVDEFLARLLGHVPSTDMQTVRAYRLYANSKRAELGRAREHFGQTPRPADRTCGRLFPASNRM